MANESCGRLAGRGCLRTQIRLSERVGRPKPMRSPGSRLLRPAFPAQSFTAMLPRTISRGVVCAGAPAWYDVFVATRDVQGGRLRQSPVERSPLRSRALSFRGTCLTGRPNGVARVHKAVPLSVGRRLGQTPKGRHRQSPDKCETPQSIRALSCSDSCHPLEARERREMHRGRPAVSSLEDAIETNPRTARSTPRLTPRRCSEFELADRPCVSHGKPRPLQRPERSGVVSVALEGAE